MPAQFPKTLTQEESVALVDEIVAKLNLRTSAGRTFLIESLKNVCLMDGKQQDYGSSNISGFGTFGVVVRMNDKFARIKNLFSKKRRRAVNESILDSFRDISNYATIAIMVEKGEWPSE